MMHLGSLRSEQEELVLIDAGDGELTLDAALRVQHRGEIGAADLGQRVGEQPLQPRCRTCAADLVLGEVRCFRQADALAHSPALLAHGVERVRTMEGDVFLRLEARLLEPQRVLQTEARTPHRVVGRETVVDRRRVQWASGRELLVGERDAEAARVVLAHLGVGVGERRVVAVPGDIHAPDVGTGIAVHHPVGEAEADSTALREAGHDGTCAPHALHPLDRADQGIAIGAEREGAVDELLDAGTANGGEVFEAARQFRRDAIEVVGEQLEHEVPGCLLRRPRPVVLLVGAQQDALPLLAGVDLAGEIDQVRQLAAHGCVVLDDFRHRLGHQVVMLHRQHRQLESGHAAHLARPQPACVHHVLGVDRVVSISDDVPCAIRALAEVRDPGVGVHLGAAIAGTGGIGVRDAVRVDAALVLVVQRADEEPLLQKRVQLLCLLHGDDLHVHAQVPAARLRHAQPIEALRRVGQLQAPGQVDAAVLAALGLDLLVQVDRVLLQPRHVGVAVQGVHAPRGVPRAAGGQLLALEQHHVGPPGLGEVIEHAGADDTAADDDDLR